MVLEDDKARDVKILIIAIYWYYRFDTIYQSLRSGRIWHKVSF